MNLRIADGPELVAFLHGVVVRAGTPILATGGFEVVRVDGRVFYHRDDPLTVGGPFLSLEALVRSEGIRRYREDGKARGDVEAGEDGPRHEPRGAREEADPVEVFEWASSFFRIEGEGEARLLTVFPRS